MVHGHVEWAGVGQSQDSGRRQALVVAQMTTMLPILPSLCRTVVLMQSVLEGEVGRPHQPWQPMRSPLALLRRMVQGTEARKWEP